MRRIIDIMNYDFKQGLAVRIIIMNKLEYKDYKELWSSPLSTNYFTTFFFPTTLLFQQLPNLTIKCKSKSKLRIHIAGSTTYINEYRTN